MGFVAPLVDKGFSDFNPMQYGYSHCKPGRLFTAVREDYAVVHYIFSGSGTVTVNGRSHKVGARQIFVVPPNVENSYVADNDSPWFYTWIAFGGKLSFRFSQLPTVMDYNGSIFFEMMDVANMQSMQEEFLTHLLFKLYIQLFPEVTKPDYIKRAMYYIDAHINDPSLTVDKLSSVLNIERSHLTKLFKEKSGKTVHEYFTSIRMTNAINLLQSGVSVNETAKLVGYSDVYTFSKAFKKRIGKSPKEYKITDKV